MRSLLLFLLIPILSCAAGPAAAAVPRPNLVPLPQEVAPLARAIPLPADAAIVCEGADAPMLQAGLEELGARLKALGGALPPTRSAAEADRATLTVVVGTPDDSPRVAALAREMRVSITGENPGPQGYVIRFSGDGRRVLLAGSDLQGALYACVTFSQMLRREGARILIDAANVRDRPDFRYRLIGHPRAPSEKLRAAQTRAAAGGDYDGYVRSMRQSIDFCLRFRINGVSLRSGGTAKWSNVQSFGPAVRAALREVSDYARARGVFLEATAYSAVDVGQGGPASEVDCLRTHGVGYCWSRDDLLRAQAREFARFAHEAGIGLYYLHAPDRTYVDDPSGFGKRCDLCKRRWRDDERAKADAHVMNIAYEEIRKASPETRMCAVLVPYGATLDRLDAGVREGILKYWREASALLPEDMLICVRENRRPNVAAFKEAFARQPIYFYIESIFWRGWEPLFTTTPRVIGTFDFDDPRDLYYLGNGGDFRPLAEAMAAHYAWNTDAPGAGQQRAYNHDPIRDGTEPAVVAHDLVDAIASRIFGDDVGSLVGEAVRGDISWAFTADPEGVSRAARERLAGRGSDIPGWEAVTVRELEDLPALMRRQVEGSERGLHALLQAAERVRRGEAALDPWQQEQLHFLLSYTASVNALAAVRAPALAAAAAMRAKEYARAAETAKEGLVALDAAPRRLDEVATHTGSPEAWYSRARRVRDRVAAEKETFELLERLARGVVLEQVDTPENLAKACFLLRGRNARTRSLGNGTLELAEGAARTPGHPALLYTRPAKPWEGCSVSFDPVDLRPFLAGKGFLRFYVNSAGPKGWHRATFIPILQGIDAAGKPGAAGAGRWVYLHPPTAEERQRNGRPGFVDVDDLEETWQLVSIPLRELVGEDGAYLAGWTLNFAALPEHGLLIADPYVIGGTQPVTVERRLR